MRRNLATVLAFTGLALLTNAIAPACAYAYLDAGTGALVVQWIIAGVVGGGLAIKLFWGRISGMLKKKSPAADADATSLDSPVAEASDAAAGPGPAEDV
jgi:hypothetical protein